MPGIKIGRSKAQLPLRVEVEKILVPDGFTRTLNDHLLLVYTGKTRLARNLLQVTPGCCTLCLLLPPLEHFGACPLCWCRALPPHRELWHRRLWVWRCLPGCCWSQEGGDRTFWPLAGRGEKLVRQAALHRAER